ncbi:manganese-dependent inorganic pyrophosphatase [Xylocopilactobacillus apicola]|uniref:inorganic diphosphatase n=1 Tax=Xylocopilactobacillus apicola TaxID=2932184 RepID=A0AAU9D481_9LACO|nr:manganese-dependent inorganic pyrophosphatase [Xylocopilactobacillus apicola]BDR58584.1 putative manganese-dependent inorganic pyrophosphatase [Xylocopilactobacillus apicola]
MDKEIVFGHTNPDTDAVGAAMAAADYFKHQNVETEAVALGKPNEETKFALDYFHLTMPRVIEKADTEKVILVDHNEANQSVANFNDLTITHVVDHHKIDLKTDAPLFYHAEPVGCTSTILFDFYQKDQIEIPKGIAGMMLSAIISDTLLLKSPTTTDQDRKAVEQLAKIADVEDYQAYGMELLKAGTNLANRTNHDIIEGDAKSFEMNGKKVRIGQVNTVDIDEVLNRPGLKEDIEQELKTQGYDDILLVVTNILDSNSKGIFYGVDQIAVEKAFDGPVNDHIIDLPGVVSRKKQIVPNLTKEME